MHVKYWAPINSYPIGKVVQNIIHVYAKYWTPLHWFSFSFGQMLLNYLLRNIELLWISSRCWDGNQDITKRRTQTAKVLKRNTVVICFGEKKKRLGVQLIYHYSFIYYSMSWWGIWRCHYLAAILFWIPSIIYPPQKNCEGSSMYCGNITLKLKILGVNPISNRRE